MDYKRVGVFFYPIAVTTNTARSVAILFSCLVLSCHHTRASKMALLFSVFVFNYSMRILPCIPALQLPEAYIFL